MILSDEMVEAGARAIFAKSVTADFSIDWEDARPDAQDYWRAAARACLSASLPMAIEEIIPEEPHLTMKLVGGKMISDGRPDQMSNGEFAGEIYKAMLRRSQDRIRSLITSAERG